MTGYFENAEAGKAVRKEELIIIKERNESLKQFDAFLSRAYNERDK